jgi:hypothetical protein
VLVESRAASAAAAAAATEAPRLSLAALTGVSICTFVPVNKYCCTSKQVLLYQ